jgi:hypothetical protein
MILQAKGLENETGEDKSESSSKLSCELQNDEAEEKPAERVTPIE